MTVAGLARIDVRATLILVVAGLNNTWRCVWTSGIDIRMSR